MVQYFKISLKGIYDEHRRHRAEIVFRNDENGWTVINIDFSGELTTAVGACRTSTRASLCAFFGAWTEHRCTAGSSR